MMSRNLHSHYRVRRRDLACKVAGLFTALLVVGVALVVLASAMPAAARAGVHSFPLWLSAAQTSSQKADVREAVEIDTNAGVHPFPHFWEKMFGSGRAVLSLREDYRNDLQAVKRVTG